MALPLHAYPASPAPLTREPGPIRRPAGQSPLAVVIPFPAEAPARRPLSQPLPRIDRATAMRRRRAIVAALAFVLVAALGQLAAVVLETSPSAAPAAPPARLDPAPVAASVYIVQPGDTVWQIARTLQPTGDIRPLVDEIVAQHGAALQVGDRVDLSGF